MAATLAQNAALALDATFRSRVKDAMMRRLMTLLTTPGNLTSDQLALARKMVYDPVPHADIIAHGVVTESAIIARDGAQAAVTDAEITASVTAILARYVV